MYRQMALTGVDAPETSRMRERMYSMVGVWRLVEADGADKASLCAASAISRDQVLPPIGRRLACYRCQSNFMQEVGDAMDKVDLTNGLAS